MSEDSHSDRAGFDSAGPRRINRARQAAEALFAPKRQIEDPTSPDAAGSAQQDVHKPRILSAVTAIEKAIQPPDVEATKRPVQHQIRRSRKRVPASHRARIRSWLKYGMTIGQAADVYGVSVDQIERILQKA